jgi:release factor glutamine methyltransferase
MEIDIPLQDIESLRREKYAGDKNADMSADMKRLAAGEPLAYIIGHIPFLGMSLNLFSRPLIPRPETEWWTEELATYIGERPLRVLDLCAGSGAIGLALLKLCPNVQVSFGERMEEHEAVIRKNIQTNGLDVSRAEIRIGDLFAPYLDLRNPDIDTFDILATNPPYIPTTHTLDASVTNFEPHGALYAGDDGLSIIRRILRDAPTHLNPKGEVWMECDISNIDQASVLAMDAGASYTKIRTDQYQRPRLLVAYY